MLSQLPHLAHPDRAAAAAGQNRVPVRGVQTAVEGPCVCSEIAQDILQEARRRPAERRPTFHLAPASGWLNDPNGPLLHNGSYHLFYQHVPNSSEWAWGLVWGHAKSQDLVTWQHLPVALEPTPGGLDRHGVFSGCATLDLDGRPCLLYTGVVRKQPHEIQPGVSPQHESQMIAVAADPDDPDLTTWHKLPGAFLPQPPPEMDLTGWRDPFVLERPTAASPWWVVMVGAGVRGKCASALVYRSRELTQGWEYVGPLCESRDSFMWECPVMVRLSSAPPHFAGGAQRQQQQQEARGGGGGVERHLLAVSPDYCVNMVQGFLGSYAGGRFDLDAAAGPFPLDLGDCLYAPNLLTDKQGRTVLWAWVQENQHLRPAGAYASSCCLCVPRVLYLSPDGSALCQEPLPELAQLRQPQPAWLAGAARAGADGEAAQLLPRRPLSLLPGGGGGGGSSSSSSVDLELEVAPGSADAFAVVLHAFDDAPGAAGAAISYSWSTNTLQVIHCTDLGTLERVAALPLPPKPHYRQPGPDRVQVAAAEAAAAGPGVPSRCGGVLQGNGAPSAGHGSGNEAIRLRVLLDGSCLEVFTGCGQALATRVYRGDEPPLPAQQQPAPHLHHSGNDAALAGRGARAVPAAEAEAVAAAAAAAAAGAISWEELFFAGTGAHRAAAGGVTGGGIQLVSFGPGPAQLLHGAAWQMHSMWQQQELLPDEAVAQPSASASALAGARAAVSAALPAAAATAVAGAVVQSLVAAEATAVAAAATVAPVVLQVGELPVDAAASGPGLPLSPSSMPQAGHAAVQVEAA